jgi:tetrahydromethanopterin S-methyltransferase subunit C
MDVIGKVIGAVAVLLLLYGLISIQEVNQESILLVAITLGVFSAIMGKKNPGFSMLFGFGAICAFVWGAFLVFTEGTLSPIGILLLASNVGILAGVFMSKGDKDDTDKQ